MSESAISLGSAPPNPDGKPSYRSFILTLFPVDAPCPEMWELKVASLLQRKGYDLDRTREILEICRESGSAHCCDLFDSEVDRYDVERLLPESSEGWWESKEQWVWATNEN